MQNKIEQTHLNIHENKKMLVVTALNSCKTKKEAAQALGITERSLYTYIDDFNILRGHFYHIPQKTFKKRTAAA